MRSREALEVNYASRSERSFSRGVEEMRERLSFALVIALALSLTAFAQRGAPL